METIMSKENKAATNAFTARMAKATVWKDARILMVDVSVPKAAAAALLPPGLTLSEPPRVSLFIADYPTPGSYGDPYLEAAILVHASDDKGKLCYCPWILVTTDTALILGRELLGFPKKLGTISLIEEAGKVIGIVSRKDAEIIRIEAVLGTQESPEATPSPFGRTVNVIGTIVEGMKFIDIPPMPATIHRSHIVQGKIALTSSKTDALGALEAKPDCHGRYVKLDFGGGTETAKIIGVLDESWGPMHFVERAF